MKDREAACWFLGGALALFSLIVGGVGYQKVRVATIWAEERTHTASVKTDGWVQVAHEIRGAIESLTD